MGSQGLDFSFYDNFYHLRSDWRSMQVELRQEDYLSGKYLEILRRGHEIVEKEGAIEFWRIRNKRLSDVRLVKNFVFPIYNVNCKVGLCC